MSDKPPTLDYDTPPKKLITAAQLVRLALILLVVATVFAVLLVLIWLARS